MIWLILVILALIAAAIFATNVFTDWKGERTITSLKTISKPLKELDFPSVTICKDGQNMQAVMEALERRRSGWGDGKRENPRDPVQDQIIVEINSTGLVNRWFFHVVSELTIICLLSMALQQ